MLQRAVQTDLILKNSWTRSLFYTHIWPFQQETKVLGVRGTWLVTNFVTPHLLPSSESSRAVKCKFRISLLFESWSFLEHTPYTSTSAGFKHWLAWLIGFSCHLLLTRRWIFLQSGQQCQIFCHFHQEIGGSLFKSFWRLHPPWIELGRLCLSGRASPVRCILECSEWHAEEWVYQFPRESVPSCWDSGVDSLCHTPPLHWKPFLQKFQGDMREMTKKMTTKSFADVIVHVGTNYTSTKFPMDKIIENMSQIMDTAKHISVTGHVTISGICPRTDNNDAALKRNDVCDRVQQICADKGCIFVDHRDTFLTRSGDTIEELLDPHRWLALIICRDEKTASESEIIVHDFL